jgi:transmembrane sensor
MNEDITLAKWLNDEMDEAELNEFMHAPEYATYSKIKTLSARLKAPDVNLEDLYQSIDKNKTQEPKVRKLNPWLPRIAAVLVLALGISFYLFATAVITQTALAGNRDVFTLPDESEVTLNAGSEASYKEWNWSDNRKLQLNGEAYFKVAKGKTFDVVTPLGTITVVGTQFNVKVRNNRLDVTCFEGKVKVTTKVETLLLTPGKTVAFKDGKNLNLPDVTITKPGWLSNETYFANESLQNVIAEMERHYKLNITIVGNVPAKPFTGTIPMNNITTALDIIQPIYHLKSKKVGDKIILTAE